MLSSSFDGYRGQEGLNETFVLYLAQSIRCMRYKIVWDAPTDDRRTDFNPFPV